MWSKYNDIDICVGEIAILNKQLLSLFLPICIYEEEWCHFWKEKWITQNLFLGKTSSPDEQISQTFDLQDHLLKLKTKPTPTFEPGGTGNSNVN